MAVGLSISLNATPPENLLTKHRPILTPKTVLPLFFAVGVLFAPIGGLLLYASSKVRLLQESITLRK